MLKNNIEFIDLEWDTNYFGIKCGRINLYDKIDNLSIINKFIDQNRFVTIVNYNNDDVNNYTIQNIDKCFLSDVNVLFQKKVNDIIETFDNIIIQNNVEINNDLLDIASNRFIYSRFINDKRLCSRKSKRIYFNWLKDSFNKEDKYICYDDKNNGFLLFSFDENEATIELIATNSLIKGLGSNLIKSMEKFCFYKGIKIIKVGTQLNNIIAQRFYMKNNFIIKQYNSIYHVWR